MDKNRVEGKVDDVKGRIKRQVGEWTDNSDLQAEGTLDQAKGKVQNAYGKAKDAVKDMADDAKRDDSREEEIRRDQRERDDKVA